MSMKFFEKFPDKYHGNQQPFDRFTFSHLGIGMILGANKMTPLGVTVFAIAWEVLEQPLKKKFSGMFPIASQDSLPNMTIDALAVIAGWYLVRLYDKKVTK